MPPSTTTTRETPLSRAEIATTALALVDELGVDRLTMRALAERLRVTPMAIYHHLENKDEVLQAAADQVWIEVALAFQPHDDPVEELLQGFLTVRRTFMAHPDITPYAVASPSTEDALELMAGQLAGRFERAGFTGEAAGKAYFPLASHTLGTALLHARRVMVDRAIREPVSELAEVRTEVGEHAPDASPEAHAAIREAMTSDADLARFEQSLRDIMSCLLDRYATG